MQKKPFISLKDQLENDLFRFKPIKVNYFENSQEISSLVFGNAPKYEYFSNIDKEYSDISSKKIIDKLKRSIKNIMRKYVGPVLSKNCIDAENKIFKNSKEKLVLGVGGGPHRNNGETNLNIGPWENVDLISDAHELPYKDEVVDYISCKAVFEHITYPEKAAKEFFRVLKKDSLLFISVPFLQTYHGYPHHYRGITLHGIEQILKDNGFKILDSGTAIGPSFATSSMIKDFLKYYVPFGRILSIIWKLSLGLFFSKLDHILVNNKNSYKLAFGVFCLAQK